MPARILVALVALVATSHIACTSELVAPSAYGAERYLCDAAHEGELDAIVEDCRAGGCWGVTSMRGTLQGEPFTVEAVLEASEFENTSYGPGQVMRDQIDLIGQSPYFQFKWEFKDMDGNVEDSDEQALDITLVNQHGLEARTDGRVRSSLRLMAGGASVDLFASAGTVVTRAVGLAEQSGEVDLDFGDEGAMAGCFHVLAERIKTEVAK